MFRRLFGIWGGRSLLGEAFDDFNDILEEAKGLFDKVTDILLGKVNAGTFAQELLTRDNKINGLERAVRTKIIEYLTFEPEGDRPAALVLFSVVKDAERLGDFCKDMMELAGHFRTNTEHGQYREPFLKMETQLEDMFAKAQRAFLESDARLAREVVATKSTVKHECSDLLARIMADRELDSEAAASFALLVYYFKRVGAHLFNIASSVLVPLADIGHYKVD
jgi:phosphate transport system protein